MLNIIRNIFNVLQCKTYKQTNENNTKQKNSKTCIIGTAATMFATTMVSNLVKKIKENNNVSVQSKQDQSNKSEQSGDNLSEQSESSQSDKSVKPDDNLNKPSQQNQGDKSVEEIDNLNKPSQQYQSKKSVQEIDNLNKPSEQYQSNKSVTLGDTLSESSETSKINSKILEKNNNVNELSKPSQSDKSVKPDDNLNKPSQQNQGDKSVEEIDNLSEQSESSQSTQSVKENNNVSKQSEPGKIKTKKLEEIDILSEQLEPGNIETKTLPTQLEHHRDEISSDANNNTNYLNTDDKPEEEILIPAKEDQTNSSNEEFANKPVNSVIESLSYILAEHRITGWFNNSYTNFIKQKQQIVQDISNIEIKTCADLKWQDVDKKLDIIFEPSSPRAMSDGSAEILPQCNEYITSGCSLNSSMSCFFALFAQYLEPCVQHINDIKNDTVDLNNNIWFKDPVDILFFGKWLYIFFSIIDVQNIHQVSKMLLILLIQLKIIDEEDFVDKNCNFIPVNLFDIAPNVYCKLFLLFSGYMNSIKHDICIVPDYMNNLFQSEVDTNIEKNNSITSEQIEKNMEDTQKEIINICTQDYHYDFLYSYFSFIGNDELETFLTKYNYTQYDNIEDYKAECAEILCFTDYAKDNVVDINRVKDKIEKNMDNTGFLLFLAYILDQMNYFSTTDNEGKTAHIYINDQWIYTLFLQLIIRNTGFISEKMIYEISHEVIKQEKQLSSALQNKPINYHLLFTVGHFISMVQYKGQILMMDLGRFRKQKNWQHVLEGMENIIVIDDLTKECVKIKRHNSNSYALYSVFHEYSLS